jgi:hypothetical protein
LAIVGEQDATFSRSPVQDRRIWRLQKPDIVDANEVEIGQTAKKTTQDIVVKILVAQEPNH